MFRRLPDFSSVDRGCLGFRNSPNHLDREYPLGLTRPGGFVMPVKGFRSLTNGEGSMEELDVKFFMMFLCKFNNMGGDGKSVSDRFKAAS
ncbi:MAG: hypothetical protein LBQ88_03635 [Treponema sp.]|jgi:hypothetical protein|nr:hypothetical protein [Treponema sp.]